MVALYISAGGLGRVSGVPPAKGPTSDTLLPCPPSPYHCSAQVVVPLGGGGGNGFHLALPTLLSSFSHLRGRGAGLPWGLSDDSLPGLALASLSVPAPSHQEVTFIV